MESTYKHHTYYLSIDLGQANDFTAISIVERILTRDTPMKYRKELVMHADDPNRYEKEFNLLHLERPPLGTPYTAIVDRTLELYDSPKLEGRVKAVVIDTTGLGTPVYDLMVKANIMRFINGVTITGGSTVTYELKRGGIRFNVPKRDLVAALQLSFQNKELKIAAGLPNAEIFVHELTNFKVKINVNGHDQYEAHRQGDHDDLVLSVAMAVWAGQQRRTLTNEVEGVDGKRGEPPKRRWSNY